MSFDPLSYALGAKAGGGGLRPTRLSVTENGSYTPEAGECFTEVEVAVAAENANERMDLLGTLAVPWLSQESFGALLDGLTDGSVSAELTMTVSGVTASAPLQAAEGLIQASLAAYHNAGNGFAVYNAAQFLWSENGLERALVTMEGVTADLAASAAQIPVRLSVLLHPMPAEEPEHDCETDGHEYEDGACIWCGEPEEPEEEEAENGE
jgi:hypothetical protein